MSRYASSPDPYCYPGSGVLRNLPGIRNAADLERFESVAALARAREALPSGRLGVAHYRAVHRHLFQDVYDWAGRFRTVRASKGYSSFCYPEWIGTEMQRLFSALRSKRRLRGLDALAFADEAAWFLAELNAIHPFREGNGRTQMAFMSLVARKAGHPLDLGRLDRDRFLSAMIVSFSGNRRALSHELFALIENS